MSDVLRAFGMVDSFRLRELIERPTIPTKAKIVEHLRTGTKSLPPSISPEFVAANVLTALLEADRKGGISPNASMRLKLDSIKPGRADASKYHHKIFAALNHIFDGWLKNGVIEREVDEGRKRVDILFENRATSGFFERLETQHKIFCPLIFVECKNYSHDPENPEFDQLLGRFHDKRGRFGIMVCRKITDAKLKRSRCGDIIGGGTGCLIVLDDKDVIGLVQARDANDLDRIDDLLSQRLTEVLLNAH